MNVPVLSEDGGRTGEVELLDAIFAAKVNVPLMHQVVVAQLAAARAGSNSIKTRAEVRGGGRKPWRQKGTGRARHGSIREPQWVGGGVAHGPKPRDYSQATPKKMKAAALRSALSDRASEGQIRVIEELAFDAPKTKRAVTALRNWEATGKVLLVLTREDTLVAYSFRNLQNAHVIAEDQLNVYDVLRADTVIFARPALEAFQERAGSTRRRRGGDEPELVLEAAPVPATEDSAPAPGEAPEAATAPRESDAPDAGGDTT